MPTAGIALVVIGGSRISANTLLPIRGIAVSIGGAPTTHLGTASEELRIVISPKPLGRIGRAAMWLSPIVIVAAFITLWWLKDQNRAAASVLGPAVAIFLMGYVTFMTSRQQRRLDEVQLASQGFANSHGWVAGTIVTVLLLMLPPVTSWLVDLVNTSSTGSPDLSDRRAVGSALIYGVCVVVLIQTLGVFIAAAIWWRRMGGMGERS
jgi:hypothetical protein